MGPRSLDGPTMYRVPWVQVPSCPFWSMGYTFHFCDPRDNLLLLKFCHCRNAVGTPVSSRIPLCAPDDTKASEGHRTSSFRNLPRRPVRGLTSQGRDRPRPGAGP